MKNKVGYNLHRKITFVKYCRLFASILGQNSFVQFWQRTLLLKMIIWLSVQYYANFTFYAATNYLVAEYFGIENGKKKEINFQKCNN